MCENSYQDADEKWMKSLELSVALLNESGIHWKTVDV